MALARLRKSLPLSLASLRDAFPSPARGEGLGTHNLPRLVIPIQRNEGEFTRRHFKFPGAVAFSRDGMRLKRH
jgi:hypothetical protein